MFELESTRKLQLAANDTTVKVFRYNETDFRIVFVPLPGPLCSCSIVIPTLVSDDKGLPHTLEHLIFCGSESYRRGFLDILATRSLSTGTNAYTDQDHTCYEITTAGWDGMVHHIDHEGKHQGVVYCEMASREDTESDLLYLNMRKLLFQNETTYSFECGGLTKDISVLDNAQVKKYHSKFYHLHNTTAIISGPVDPQSLFKKLEQHKSLFKVEQLQKIEIVPHPTQTKQQFTSKTVHFPSADTSVGSISYGWMGPRSEDIKTIVALDILFRYLQDTPASPLAQEFVERESPLASSIDFELSGNLDTYLILSFSGVPCFISNGHENNETDLDEDDEESNDDNSVINQDSRKDLFDEGIYYDILKKQLEAFMKKGSKDGGIQATIKIHRQKLEEKLEDDPHTMVASSLVPDILRYFFANSSALNDTKSQNGVPYLGTRGEIFNIITELSKEPESYWTSLAKTWLLERPVFEVMMVPDQELAEQKRKSEIAEQKKRIKKLGPKKLSEIKSKIEAALEENKVNLQKHDVKLMPPIPDASKAPLLQLSQENIDLDTESFPFSVAQVIRTETVFVHLGLGLNLSGLDQDLRPYLVLFQELLFQSPLRLPSPSDETKWIMMDYKEVVKYSSDLYVSHDLGVGIQNALWTTSWLGQLLTLFTTSNSNDWERMIRFACQVLFFTEFRHDRIVTTAKNLLSSLIESKRDGDFMLGALMGRVSDDPAHPGSCANDFAISVFKQEQFLKNVISTCTTGDSLQIISSLDKIRNHIIQLGADEPHFLRISVPMSFKVNGNNAKKDLALDVKRIWTSENSKALSRLDLDNKKRKSAKEPVKPFPFPRIPWAMNMRDKTFSKSVACAIEALNTSYFIQFIECDILRPHPHPDYWPLVLLVELISTSEGPLFNAVRGKGFAYGASLSVYLWSGQLTFELYRASEPVKAMLSFYEIIESVLDAKKFDSLFTSFEIETAQSCLAYRWVAEKSTASSLISTSLRASIQGFSSIKEHSEYIQNLYKVTKKDLYRVGKKYLSAFLSDSKVSCLVSVPGDSMSNFVSEFKTSKYPLDFTLYETKDFDL